MFETARLYTVDDCATHGDAADFYCVLYSQTLLRLEKTPRPCGIYSSSMWFTKSLYSTKISSETGRVEFDCLESLGQHEHATLAFGSLLYMDLVLCVSSYP